MKFIKIFIITTIFILSFYGASGYANDAEIIASLRNIDVYCVSSSERCNFLQRVLHEKQGNSLWLRIISAKIKSEQNDFLGSAMILGDILKQSNARSSVVDLYVKIELAADLSEMGGKNEALHILTEAITQYEEYRDTSMLYLSAKAKLRKAILLDTAKYKIELCENIILKHSENPDLKSSFLEACAIKFIALREISTKESDDVLNYLVDNHEDFNDIFSDISFLDATILSLTYKSEKSIQNAFLNIISKKYLHSDTPGIQKRALDFFLIYVTSVNCHDDKIKEIINLGLNLACGIDEIWGKMYYAKFLFSSKLIFTSEDIDEKIKIFFAEKSFCSNVDSLISLFSDLNFYGLSESDLLVYIDIFDIAIDALKDNFPCIRLIPMLRSLSADLKSKIGYFDQAIKDYEIIISTNSMKNDIDILAVVAHAMFSKAGILGSISSADKFQSAIDSYNLVIDKFKTRKEPYFLQIVYDSLFRKGLLLREFDKNGAESTYKQMVQLYQNRPEFTERLFWDRRILSSMKAP